MLFLLTLGIASSVALANPPGGPHEPVTICHKPGTPAEQTLVVDDDAVPGHLGHGDYLGVCKGQTTPTDTTPTTPTDTTPTTPTDTVSTTPTETTPTEPTPTTPENDNLCDDGLPPDAGKDGQVPASGNTNDDCDHSVVPPAPPASSSVTQTTTSSPPTVVTVKPLEKKKKTETVKSKKPEILKVSKPNKYGVVKMKLSDGRTVSGYMGQG